jgi:hypothetical protein
MMLSLSASLYAFASIAILWLAVLWVCSRLNRSRRLSVGTKIAVGAATSLLLLLPISGVPLWMRVFSFHPNPSVPLLGIALGGLWFRLFGGALFQPRDWHAIWIFGAVAGSVLYLHPMMFGTVDLYFWGWDRTVSAWSVGGVAIAFLGCGSRLGILLLGALLAYRLTALESLNCWDYVMDPIYWMISNAVLAVRGILAGLRRIEWIAPRPDSEEPVRRGG